MSTNCRWTPARSWFQNRVLGQQWEPVTGAGLVSAVALILAGNLAPFRGGSTVYLLGSEWKQWNRATELQQTLKNPSAMFNANPFSLGFLVRTWAGDFKRSFRVWLRTGAT